MASQRQSQQEAEGDDSGAQIIAQHSKRRRGEDSQEDETTSIHIGNLSSMLRISSTDIGACISDLVRRSVKEELEQRLFQRPPTVNQTGTSGARFLQLDFKKELPAIIFTDSKIKARDDTPVEIVLYDIRSQSIVTDGPLSKMKIEICVLNGEFDSSGGTGDWTAEEFKAKTLRQRENKGKLLKGDVAITLKNGVAYISNVRFTDNSSWLRSGKFRLGAKALQSISINEANIREAKSDPFVVKDRRGNQKHYPPSPRDEIWRLTKISRDGKRHQRLSSEGINTVEDLLRWNENDPSSLEKIVSKKEREAIIEHAKTCVDEKVTFDGPVNTLHSDEKCLGERENSQHAFINVKDLIPVDETAVHSTPNPLADLQWKWDGPDFRVLDFPTARQEERQDFSQPSTSTSHICEAAHNNQVCFPELSSGTSMEGNALSFLASQVPPAAPNIYLTETDYSDIQFLNDDPFLTWERGQGYNNCFGEGFGMHASFPSHVVGTSSINVKPKPKPKAVWGQQETWPFLCQPSTSTSQIGESAHIDQVGADQLLQLREMPLNRYADGEFLSGECVNGGNGAH